MEVNKIKKEIYKVKDSDIISEETQKEKRSSISFIHIFESDIISNPKIKLTKKEIRKKKKLEKRKVKAFLIAKQEAEKEFWTPEMKIGYCKHSIRKFMPLKQLQNYI